MCPSGFISGLVAQSELTRLLDELYAGPDSRHTLLDELLGHHNLASLNEAGKANSRALYSEVASIFG